MAIDRAGTQTADYDKYLGKGTLYKDPKFPATDQAIAFS